MRLQSGLFAASVLASSVMMAACGSSSPSTPMIDAGPAPFIVNATLVPAPPEGLLHAGRVGDGTVILPNGKKITPAGDVIEVGGFILGSRIMPGGKHLVTTDGDIYDETLSVIDIGSKQIVQTEPFSEADQQALFLGLAIRSDGTLFASGGGQNVIHRYTYDASAAMPLTPLADFPVTAGNYVAGLAFADDTRLVAAYQLNETVGIIDTMAGTELGHISLTGNDPYDVAVDKVRQEAYVSMWGSASVVVLDVSGPTPVFLAQIDVGKNPEALLLFPPAAPTQLLVANSDADTISIIDLDARTVTDELTVTPPTRPEHGSIPNHLALSPDGTRLYVADAGDNCVDAFDTQAWTRVGRVPTAWYPTSVTVGDDGTLFIASAKGYGANPINIDGPRPSDNTVMKATIQIVAPPLDADLQAGATQVEANDLRPQMVGPSVTCPSTGECRYPLPPMAGMPTPIEHVVVILRENKTYDSELGDLGDPNADGEPKVIEFDETMTPNLHALAREFTNFDNFYSDAEASLQGHNLVTGGMLNDYVEKGWLTGWGRYTRPTTTFADPISAPVQGYYWQHLARAGIDYISYGEIVGAQSGVATDAPIVLDTAWPGGPVFNLTTKDVDRAVYFTKTIQQYDFLPHFTYVLLPNNHTQGTTPGTWTPEYMVSDNDEATGRMVDTISHSRFWPSTAIFILEDDPSDGWDHIDAHRSTLVVVSPWVNRHVVEHVIYDVPSMWRTIEQLIGLPPESQQTATAAAMYDIWASTPDLTPYTFIPGGIPEALNPDNDSPTAQMSKRLDFSSVDRAPGLGRVLWEHFKGSPPPWPPRPDERYLVEGKVRFPVLGVPVAPKAKDPGGDYDED